MSNLRELRKKWILVAGELEKHPNKKIACPNNSEHFVQSEIMKHPEYNRKEIVLWCDNCDVKYTITKVIEVKKQEEKNSNLLKDIENFTSNIDKKE